MTPDETMPAAEQMRDILKGSDLNQALREGMILLATIHDWGAHRLTRLETRLNTLATEHDAVMEGRVPCRQIDTALAKLETGFWRTLAGRLILPVVVGVCSGGVVAVFAFFALKK